jgi:dihydroorotase
MITRREFSKSILAGGTAALLTSEMPLSAGQETVAHDESPRHDVDLLIKGGTVVDPSQHLHAALDVAVKYKKILEVSPDIPESRARKVFSAKDKIVTPGLIDLHVHCFDGYSECVNADRYCLGRGVTTVMDAGTTGYLLIGRFVKDIVATSITRVYPLVHVCPIGPVTGLEHPLENLKWVNPQLTARGAEANKPAVVGIKVHLSKSYSSHPQDLEPELLKRTVEIAEIAHLPLMAHVNDTYYPLADTLKKMRKGDIFTHAFNSYPQDCPLDANGKIRPEVREARERGVIFDTAKGDPFHGHFNFTVADKCLQQDFLPDTISTDLNNRAATEWFYDLPLMVSEFLALGMDLDKAIERVTVNPAKVFNYGVQIGTLRPGSEADIGVFELQEGKFEFVGGGGEKRAGRQKLVNKATVCRGNLFVNEA